MLVSEKLGDIADIAVLESARTVIEWWLIQSQGRMCFISSLFEGSSNQSPSSVTT